jgi:hypothetical protein
MKKHLIIALFTFFIAQSASARSVYLNGTDISSARGQQLKNVSIHINEKGDVFITAPHYQVNEEDAYVPLSKFVQGMNTPMHKKPQAVSSKDDAKVPVFENGQLKKAGDSLPKVAKKAESSEDDDKSESKDD